MQYIVEISVIIKGDDRLALEATQEAILEKVDLLAGEFEVEAVAQPIRENDPDQERAVYIGRGLCTEAEAEQIWGSGL